MWTLWSSLFIPLLVLLSQTSVFASGTNVHGNHGILRRQTGGSGSILNQVPEGCRTTCGPFDIILTGCTTPKCVCNVPNYIALKICMDCVVDYGTGTPTYQGLRERGQAVLSTFGSDCQRQGVFLSPVALNTSPAPASPGTATVTAIPSIATRSQITSTASMTSRPQSGGGGSDDGTSNDATPALSISLASLISMVIGAMVAVF